MPGWWAEKLILFRCSASRAIHFPADIDNGKVGGGFGPLSFPCQVLVIVEVRRRWILKYNEIGDAFGYDRE